MKESKLFRITTKALNAFWQVVVDHYPQAASGDVSALTQIRLIIAAENAFAESAGADVPTKGGRHERKRR